MCLSNPAKLTVQRSIPSSPQLYGTFGSQIVVHHCDGYETDYIAIDTAESTDDGYLTLDVTAGTQLSTIQTNETLVKEACWPISLAGMIMLVIAGVLVVAGAIVVSMWLLRQRKADYSQVPNEISLQNI